jgi:hypothetical protein
MPRASDVSSRHAVPSAIGEFDQIGRDAFLITRRSRVRIPPPLLRKSWKSRPPRDRRVLPFRADRRLISFDGADRGAKGGGEIGRPQALGGMTDEETAPTADVLDVLVDQLLACGAPISQMMARMNEFEASGLSSPDAPPTFEVAHSLIRSVVDDLTERYSDDQIQVASEIVAQATIAICENIFFVPPSEIRRSRGGSGSAGSRRRRRRSSGRRGH